MAPPVSSLHYSHSHLFLLQSSAPPPHKGGVFRKCPTLQLLCSTSTSTSTSTSSTTSRNQQHQEDNPITAGRRQYLFQTAFTAFTFPTSFFSLAFATENDVVDDFIPYSDDVNKFKIMIPRDWQIGSGDSSGFKSVTAFYPEGPSSSNVAVVITGLGADFTRLESFGKVDAFAESLVNGLDRSWQRPAGVAAKLIDCKAANGLYYIEYTLQNPGESRRHLFSVLGMANNGWYNRLYTVTGQFVEEDSERYGSQIEKAVASFKFF